jgi:hypothetical protein
VRFVTRSRIRGHGTLLALCLWALFCLSVTSSGVLDRSGTLKGSDFLQFYTLGSLVDTPAQLYDVAAFGERAQALVPEAKDAHYLPIYGPQLALAFAPFAQLSYGIALALFSLLGLLVHAACVWAVWRRCPALRREPGTVWLLAAAQPALFACVGFGQLGWLALLAFTLCYLALAHQRPFAAGLALGLLAYKPQLGLVAGAVFLGSGQWRVVAGALSCAALQLCGATLALGADAMRGYVEMLMRLGTLSDGLAHSPHQMHSLRAFFDLLLPAPVALSAYIASALGVTALALRHFRAEAPLAQRFALLLVASVLVNPHLYLYDLVVLAPAWLLLADACLSEPRAPHLSRVPTLLYAGFVLPVLGPLAATTHVQLSVLAFVGLALCLTQRPSTRQAAALSPETAIG